ncbi:MAG: PIN domain-containing protein [Balneolales bacterium]
MKHSVLLDTSFFIRLLNDEDPLHENAKGYFKYFLENEISLKTSTISIAEYCVGGELLDLPLEKIQIIPFNLDHAQKTGDFAAVIFEANKIALKKLSPRAIIPNDSKLFAQAHLDRSITHFVTSDARSQQTIRALKTEKPTFKILDIRTPYHEYFGLLDL